MQLIMSPASPFVRRVRVTIREVGITDLVEEVPVTTTPLASAPEAAAANPSGKIPSLLREDGPAIHDSRVICRYLNAVADARLYPESRIWEVLTLEATGDALMEAAVSMVYEARFKGTEGASADWIAAQWVKVVRILGALESRWMSHLMGPVDAGQIAVASGLEYIDFRLPDRDWRVLAPALAGWLETFAQRPSMQATRPG
ncbi:glutathione S-transferase family protein [Roseisalinus antarcticus]|uniref:Putative GST-like protein YibF n=1 Tax=Roseisalinus antarcticus TaxID=254357 RepID=A0A1Y5U2X0_9RHOB|nr:glutathione S-transferase family protein [Roseisalinus antarcticus]SLN75856.1 putative GST-like protein YibF [Roseisalinus antarcticus]